MSYAALRSAQVHIEGSHEQRLAETLERVSDAGPDGYVLRTDIPGTPAGFELDALHALMRLHCVWRGVEETDQAGPCGIKLTRYRYYLTDSGAAKLSGKETERPTPVLDADAADVRMLDKRAQLAARGSA